MFKTALTVEQKLHSGQTQKLLGNFQKTKQNFCRMFECSDDTDDDGLIYATAIKWDFIQGTLKIVNIV